MAKKHLQGKDVNPADADVDKLDSFDDLEDLEKGFDSQFDDLNFEEDENPGDRTPISEVKSALTDISGMTESVASGVLSSTKDRIDKEFKGLGKLIDTSIDIKSEFDRLRSDFMSELRPLTNESRSLVRTALPLIDRYIPDKISKMLSDFAGQAEEHADEETSKNRAREESIAESLNNIFKEQVIEAEQRNKITAINRTLDQKLESSRHGESMSVMTGVYQQTKFNTAFLRTTFTAYLKKDLELKYKQLYLTEDILAANKSQLEILESRLDAVVKNTGLPDAVKVNFSELVAAKAKNAFIDNIGEATKNVFGGIRKRLMDEHIKPTIDALSEMLSGVSMGADMLAGMQGMGPSLAQLGVQGGVGMGAGYLTQGILGKIISKIPKDKKLMFQSLFSENPQFAISMLLRQIKDGEIKLPGSDSIGIIDSINEFLKTLLPDIDTTGGRMNKEVVATPIEKLHEAGVISNRFIDTVEKIIPGYLRMQTNFLSRLAEKLAPETKGADLVYNWQEGKFSTKAEIQEQAYKEIYQTKESRASVLSSTISDYKKAYKTWYGEKGVTPDASKLKSMDKRLEEYGKDIAIVIENIADSRVSHKLELDWIYALTKPGVSPGDQEAGGEYTKKAFKSIKKDDVPQVAGFLCAMCEYNPETKDFNRYLVDRIEIRIMRRLAANDQFQRKMQEYVGLYDTDIMVGDKDKATLEGPDRDRRLVYRNEYGDIVVNDVERFRRYDDITSEDVNKDYSTMYNDGTFITEEERHREELKEKKKKMLQEAVDKATNTNWFKEAATAIGEKADKAHNAATELLRKYGHNQAADTLDELRTKSKESYAEVSEYLVTKYNLAKAVTEEKAAQVREKIIGPIEHKIFDYLIHHDQEWVRSITPLLFNNEGNFDPKVHPYSVTYLLRQNEDLHPSLKRMYASTATQDMLICTILPESIKRVVALSAEQLETLWNKENPELVIEAVMEGKNFDDIINDAQDIQEAVEKVREGADEHTETASQQEQASKQQEAAQRRHPPRSPTVRKENKKPRVIDLARQRSAEARRQASTAQVSGQPSITANDLAQQAIERQEQNIQDQVTATNTRTRERQQPNYYERYRNQGKGPSPRGRGPRRRMATGGTIDLNYEPVGTVDHPTLIAGGRALVGEAGRETIVPHNRTAAAKQAYLQAKAYHEGNVYKEGTPDAPLDVTTGKPSVTDRFMNWSSSLWSSGVDKAKSFASDKMNINFEDEQKSVFDQVASSVTNSYNSGVESVVNATNEFLNKHIDQAFIAKSLRKELVDIVKFDVDKDALQIQEDAIQKFQQKFLDKTKDVGKTAEEALEKLKGLTDSNVLTKGKEFIEALGEEGIHAFKSADQAIILHLRGWAQGTTDIRMVPVRALKSCSPVLKTLVVSILRTIVLKDFAASKATELLEDVQESETYKKIREQSIDIYDKTKEAVTSGAIAAKDTAIEITGKAKEGATTLWTELKSIFKSNSTKLVELGEQQLEIQQRILMQLQTGVAVGDTVKAVSFDDRLLRTMPWFKRQATRVKTGAQKIGTGIAKAVGWTVMSPFKAGYQAGIGLRNVLDRYDDIYLQRKEDEERIDLKYPEGHLLITEQQLKKGVYFDKLQKKRVDSIEDIVKPVYDEHGNELISSKMLKERGIEDSGGRPIGRIMARAGRYTRGMLNAGGRAGKYIGGKMWGATKWVGSTIWNASPIGSTLKAVGGAILGTGHIAKALFTKFVNIYDKKGQLLLTKEEQEYGTAVFIDGQPIKDSWSINRPVVDAESLKQGADASNVKYLITREQLREGLYSDTKGKKRIDHKLGYMFGGLLRKGIGYAHNLIGKGLIWGSISTAWEIGKWLLKGKNPYIDVWKTGQQPGKDSPTLIGEHIEKGRYIYSDGRLVKSAYGITEPVYDAYPDGNLNNSKQDPRIVITNEDLDESKGHFLIDYKGHKLTKFRGRSVAAKIALAIPKAIGWGVSKLWKGGKKLANFLGSGLGNILAGVGDWGKSLWTDSLKAIFGPGDEVKRQDLEDIVGKRLDKLYTLLDARLSKRIAGDADGDGDRDNSYADQMERKRKKEEEAKAKAAAAAAAANGNTNQQQQQQNKDDDSSLLGNLAKGAGTWAAYKVGGKALRAVGNTRLGRWLMNKYSNVLNSKAVSTMAGWAGIEGYEQHRERVNRVTEQANRRADRAVRQAGNTRLQERHARRVAAARKQSVKKWTKRGIKGLLLYGALRYLFGADDAKASELEPSENGSTTQPNTQDTTLIDKEVEKIIKEDEQKQKEWDESLTGKTLKTGETVMSGLQTASAVAGIGVAAKSLAPVLAKTPIIGKPMAQLAANTTAKLAGTKLAQSAMVKVGGKLLTRAIAGLLGGPIGWAMTLYTIGEAAIMLWDVFGYHASKEQRSVDKVRMTVGYGCGDDQDLGKTTAFFEENVYRWYREAVRQYAKINGDNHMVLTKDVDIEDVVPDERLQAWATHRFKIIDDSWFGGDDKETIKHKTDYFKAWFKYRFKPIYTFYKECIMAYDPTWLDSMTLIVDHMQDDNRRLAACQAFLQGMQHIPLSTQAKDLIPTEEGYEAYVKKYGYNFDLDQPDTSKSTVDEKKQDSEKDRAQPSELPTPKQEDRKDKIELPSPEPTKEEDHTQQQAAAAAAAATLALPKLSSDQREKTSNTSGTTTDTHSALAAAAASVVAGKLLPKEQHSDTPIEQDTTNAASAQPDEDVSTEVSFTHSTVTYSGTNPDAKNITETVPSIKSALKGIVTSIPTTYAGVEALLRTKDITKEEEPWLVTRCEYYNVPTNDKKILTVLRNMEKEAYPRWRANQDNGSPTPLFTEKELEDYAEAFGLVSSVNLIRASSTAKQHLQGEDYKERLQYFVSWYNKLFLPVYDVYVGWLSYLLPKYTEADDVLDPLKIPESLRKEALANLKFKLNELDISKDKEIYAPTLDGYRKYMNTQKKQDDEKIEHGDGPSKRSQLDHANAQNSNLVPTPTDEASKKLDEATAAVKNGVNNALQQQGKDTSTSSTGNTGQLPTSGGNTPNTGGSLPTSGAGATSGTGGTNPQIDIGKINTSGLPSVEGDIGSYVKKFESGNAGAKAVAYDSTGGTSYGTYQFATSKSSDSMTEFLDWCKTNGGEFGKKVYEVMNSCGPRNTGSKHGPAPDAWKKLASVEGGKPLHALERAFYLKRVKAAIPRMKDPKLIQMVENDRGLQEAWWSTVVQHGPYWGKGRGAPAIFAKAWNALKGQATPQELAKAIYADRAGRFGSSTADVRAAVQNRFKKELPIILGLCGKAPASFDGAPAGGSQQTQGDSTPQTSEGGITPTGGTAPISSNDTSSAGGTLPTQGGNTPTGMTPDTSSADTTSDTTSSTPYADPLSKESKNVSGGLVNERVKEQDKNGKDLSPKLDKNNIDRTGFYVAGGDFDGVNPNVKARFAAAAKEYYEKTGKKTRVTSGKRSLEKQKQLRAKLGNKAAKPSPYAPHIAGLALDINYRDKKMNDDMDRLGILKKYGLHRPLAPNNPYGIRSPIEHWHIEPIGSRNKSGKITDETIAKFGKFDPNVGKDGDNKSPAAFDNSAQGVGAVPLDSSKEQQQAMGTPGSSADTSSDTSTTSTTGTSGNLPEVTGQRVDKILDTYTKDANGARTDSSTDTGNTPTGLTPSSSGTNTSTGGDTGLPPVTPSSDTSTSTTSNMGGNTPMPTDTGSSPIGGDFVEKFIAKLLSNAKGATYSKERRTSPGYYDCSSFVSRTLRDIGFKIPICSTSDLQKNLEKVGFTWNSKKVYANDIDNMGLQKGDILLKAGDHVSVYYGDGKIIDACYHGAKPTDVGLRPVGYAHSKRKNYAYNGFLRYNGATAPATANAKDTSSTSQGDTGVPPVTNQSDTSTSAEQQTTSTGTMTNSTTMDTTSTTPIVTTSPAAANTTTDTLFANKSSSITDVAGTVSSTVTGISEMSKNQQTTNEILSTIKSCLDKFTSLDGKGGLIEEIKKMIGSTSSSPLIDTEKLANDISKAFGPILSTISQQLLATSKAVPVANDASSSTLSYGSTKVHTPFNLTKQTPAYSSVS